MTEGDPIATKRQKAPTTNAEAAQQWLDAGLTADDAGTAKRSLDVAGIYASLATADAVTALDARVTALTEGMAAVRAQLAEAEHSAWLDRL